ncbi:MAG: response regulator [bacterium]
MSFTVLIIEDEEEARCQLARFVRKQNFEVLEAEDGKEGLEIFEKENPEIVITDLKMPRADGREVMHKISQKSPDTQVIIITAYGTTETIINAIREGALDYLKKPLDLDQLETTLGRAREELAASTGVTTYPTLLLAEDEQTTREKLARVLANENWQVETAPDGDEALQIFDDQKIDLVLLDIKMPGKSGLEVLREMRERSDDFAAIILTGYGDEENATVALREGASNFIRKPIDLDQMIVAVNQALENLKIKRALSYRTRELELSHEIIARITEEKEIIIDARDQTQPETRRFARGLLDTLPLGCLVVEKDKKIVYINRWLKDNVEADVDSFDPRLIEQWDLPGLAELSAEELYQKIMDQFEAEPGEVKKIETESAGEIRVAPVKLLTETEYKKQLFIATREEGNG